MTTFVVDLGQLYIRAGNAGDHCPSFYSYSLVGDYDNSHQDDCDDKMNSTKSGSKIKKNKQKTSLYFDTCLSDIDVKPCLYQPSKLIHDTSLTLYDWWSHASSVEPLCIDSDAFESLIESTFGDECGLRVSPKDKNILLTESNIRNTAIRNKVTEILFEHFEVNQLYLARKATLATMAVGRSTGMVVDIGSTFTSICPVHEGYTLQKSSQEIPLGGDLLDHQLNFLLCKSQLQSTLVPLYMIKKKIDVQYNFPPSVTSIEKIKKPKCYQSFYDYSLNEVLRNLKESISSVSAIPLSINEKKNILETIERKTIKSSNSTTLADLENKYYLPDGTIIQVSEIRNIFTECIFQFNWIFNENPTLDGKNSVSSLPSWMKNYSGLADFIVKSISQCDPDIITDLMDSVIVLGGFSVIPEFTNRLSQDINAIANGMPPKIKIVSPNSSIEKKFMSWIGGSIFGSLESAKNLWMTKEEYDEYGINLTQRKFL